MHSAQNDPSANDRRRTANLVYDDGNTAESVPANHVRDKTEQQYLKVANETLKVKRHCEWCLNCLQAGCAECIVKTCAVCESASSLSLRNVPFCWAWWLAGRETTMLALLRKKSAMRAVQNLFDRKRQRGVQFAGGEVSYSGGWYFARYYLVGVRRAALLEERSRAVL